LKTFYRIIHDTRIVGWCSSETKDSVIKFYGKKKISFRKIPEKQALEEIEEMGKQSFL
jgi:hypothetical protein